MQVVRRVDQLCCGEACMQGGQRMAVPPVVPLLPVGAAGEKRAAQPCLLAHLRAAGSCSSVRWCSCMQTMPLELKEPCDVAVLKEVQAVMLVVVMVMLW